MNETNRPACRAQHQVLFTMLTTLCVLAGCGSAEAPPAAPVDSPVATAPAPVALLHENIAPAREALQGGRVDEARGLLEAIPDDDPSYLVALRELGTLYASVGEHDAALRAFTTLTSYETDNPDLFYGRAWVEFAAGDPVAAELSTLRVLELAPDSLPARYNVAFFRLAQGRLTEASQAYHRAMKRDFAMEYVANARGHLLRLQESRPEFADVHFALAAIANAMGNRAEEEAELERYLAMEPAGPAVQVASRRLEELKGAAGS
jgi:Tfp pilus assembly protein PilF